MQTLKEYNRSTGSSSNCIAIGGDLRIPATFLMLGFKGHKAQNITNNVFSYVSRINEDNTDKESQCLGTVAPVAPDVVRHTC